MRTPAAGMQPCAAPHATRDLWVTAIGLLALLAWDVSGLDLGAARVYGNSSGFALRDNWYASTLLHDGGRLAGWAALAALGIDAAWMRVRGPSRSDRLRWLGACLACLLLVPLAKRFSRTSCPWDVAEFGGSASYVPHWLLGTLDGGPGHCFPSGHAVAAFAFFSGYFLWRDTRPRLARVWLAGVLLAGLAFGWAQLARGAHYPSHTLWSAWLCWAVCVAVDRIRPATAACAAAP